MLLIPRMYLGPYGSGNAGTARRVDDRLGRVPHGLDVVLMQVVDEGPVIPVGVLRPDPGLAADARAVRDGGLEERIHGVPALGGERNMRRRGHGLPTANREVVQVLGPVGDAVFLNVQFLIAQRGEGGRIQSPAPVQVCHDEEHVIDDDAANRHRSTISTPGLGSLRSEATRLLDGCAEREGPVVHVDRKWQGVESGEARAKIVAAERSRRLRVSTVGRTQW
jgi:hypothetical protein